MENVILDGGPGIGYKNINKQQSPVQEQMSKDTMMLSLSHDQRDASANPDANRVGLSYTAKTSNQLKIVSARANGGQQKKTIAQTLSKDESGATLQQIEHQLAFNPKITIKPYYSNAEGLTASVPQRAQTGKPQKKRKMHKSQRSQVIDKDKIYRLPSLSKCLEHEILPKSSLMLKQICEIASQNTGFIKTHFEEYVKKKAKNLFAQSLPLGAINENTPNLHVDGREKEMVLPHQKDIGGYRPKQQIQVGIKNFELTIDRQINIINQPVVMPQAMFTQSMRRPLSQQAEGQIDCEYGAKGGVNQSNASIGNRLSSSPPKSQLMQYSPQSKQHKGSIFDQMNPRNSQPSQAFKQQDIRSSQKSLRFQLPKNQNERSQNRKNVYSQSNQQQQLQVSAVGSIVKSYNGKNYIQDAKVLKKLSDTQVQTEHVRTEEDVIKTDASLKQINAQGISVHQIMQPHLGKSASSSTSIDMLTGHALQDLLNQQSVNGQSPKIAKDGMSAIEIKQYQFVDGQLAKCDQNQPNILKSAYSTANMMENQMSGQGKPANSKLGYTSSGRTLGQITILKHQTPSSLMVSAYHINQQQQKVKVRNNLYCSTAPTTGQVSPNRRYQQKGALSPKQNQIQQTETLKTSEDSSRRNNQESAPYNLLFKKIEEKEVKRSNVFIQRQHPNTNDLAPVYDFEDARNYYTNNNVRQNTNLSPRQLVTSNGGAPTSYYSMYDEKASHDPRNQSQLYQDRVRMAEHLKNTVIDSFQKNNVRTEMAYMSPDAIWGSPRPMNNETPSMPKPISSRRNTTSPKTITSIGEIQEHNNRESYIPQVIHLNNQVRLNTSYETQRVRIMASPQFLNAQQRESPIAQNPKHKENFTIVLPPTQINQISSNDISPSFMNQTQTSPQFAMTRLDTTRLNPTESESEYVRGDTLPVPSPHHQQLPSPQEEIIQQQQIQNSNAALLYVYQQQQQTSGPIKSVYQSEQEAKAHGIIKEMTFIAPSNHEVPSKQKPLAQNKLKAIRRNTNKITHSTQGSIILAENVEIKKSVPKSNRQILISNTKPASPQAEDQELLLFSESDDELAQKLMKQVLPSSFNQMKKRRGELSSLHKQLGASMDFSGRAQQKLLRNSFGIKKLDFNEFSSKDQLKSSRYRDLQKGHGDNLKLISMCIGTAPSQYRLDIPEVNSKIMQMFTPKETQDVGTAAMTAHQHIEVHQKTQLQSLEKDMDQIQNQLDNPIIGNRISIAINDKNSTMKTPNTEEYLISPRLQSNQDSWAVQTQSRGRMLMINGSQVQVNQFPQTTKNQSKPLAPPPPSILNYSKLNMQPSQLKQKYPTTSKALDTLGLTNGGGTVESANDHNITPFQDKNGEAINSSELKNLCIKTTINITHHNPYVVQKQQTGYHNKDIANVKAPPAPEPKVFESAELQQLQKNTSSSKFIQPLGVQLRQRRNGGVQYDPQLEPQQPHYIVTQNRSSQSSHVKNLLNQNLLRLNSCENLNVNSGQQTVGERYHNIPNPVQNMQQSVSTVNEKSLLAINKRDESQLTYHHNASNKSHIEFPNADINAHLSQFQDEKLHAKFSQGQSTMQN